jgi:hypothetical protein
MLSTSASLEFIEYAGIPLLIAYSSDADADNA